MEVIDLIPIELDVEDLLQTLKNKRLREKNIVPLIEDCRPLIEPKAVYTFLKVMNIEKDEVRLESGHTLKSIILADLLEGSQTIALYVVTIGPKLEEHASKEAKSSLLRGFIMESIADYAVDKATAYVRSCVKETLGNPISNFSPGSGTGKLFDIKQQETLFQILDPKTIGVRLLPSYLMLPRKSISGVLAATPQEYVACKYCPRSCEYRKKPYTGEYFGHHCEHDSI